MVVDPEYRLVARTLERDWNDKLAEVERLGWSMPLFLLRARACRAPKSGKRILALVEDLLQPYGVRKQQLKPERKRHTAAFPDQRCHPDQAGPGDQPGDPLADRGVYSRRGAATTAIL